MNAWPTWRQFWKHITLTRAQCALNDEVTRQRAEIARLRAENRALLNSILGIAGVPPIPVTEAGDGVVAQTLLSVPSADAWRDAAHASPTPASDPGPVGASAAADTPTEASVNGPASSSMFAGRSSATPLQNQRHRAANANGARIAAPVRRRSWHQINRMLEFESAKKAVTSDS